jgi:hypothetical protein
MTKQVKREGVAVSTSGEMHVSVGVERKNAQQPVIVGFFEADQGTSAAQHDGFAGQGVLAALEAENIELRNRVVDLALEVLDLQIRTGRGNEDLAIELGMR